jgi:hypothetical protein
MKTQTIGTKEQLKKCKDNYFTAKALLQTMKDIEKKIFTKVLAEHSFFYDVQWAEGSNGRDGLTGRITDPTDDYLMSDVDFKRFVALCHIEWLEHDKLHKENETLWKYEELLKNAEDALFEWMKEELPKAKPEITKESICKIQTHYKYRQSALDLTLSLEI